MRKQPVTLVTSRRLNAAGPLEIYSLACGQNSSKRSQEWQI
jgi:hypothetical protein